MKAGPAAWPWRAALLGACGLLAALASHLPVASGLDAQAHDTFSRWLPPQAAPAGLVVVDIDEESLAEIGPWPWPRPVLAQLVQRLRERGVRLQVWDVFLPDAATGDTPLQQALAAAPDVVLGQVPVIDPSVQAPPSAGELRAATDPPPLCSPHAPITGQLGVAPGLLPAAVGHLAATPDPDGRLRAVPAVLCNAAGRYPQLALAAAQALAPADPWVLTEGRNPLGPSRWLTRGALTFALDARDRLAVPYLRAHTQWPAVSAARVLTGSKPLPGLAGSVALVGATALGVGDTASTPFHPNAPGVSVQAELLGAALDGRWRSVPRQPALAAVAVTVLAGLVLLAALRGVRLDRPVGLALALGWGLAAPLGVAALSHAAGSSVPLVGPVTGLLVLVLGLLLLQAAAQRLESQRLAVHLESFLPRGLARDIATQTPSGESLGKPCQGVLLGLRVAGLERWTTSVDSLQALALMHALNSLADRCAHQHGGALEHVQGETLLMAWPATDAAAVQAALATARELTASLHELLARNETERFPLGARAAIEAGPFLLGVAGSRASRRVLLIGPVAHAVLAMLDLSDELAAPLLVGAEAAAARPVETLHPLGHFLLPDQRQPGPLYRANP